MAVATQAVRRQVYPAKKLAAEATENFRHTLNDNNAFIERMKRLGKAPKTVTVGQGMKLPALHFTSSVVVKSAKGPQFFVCESKKQIAGAVKRLKGAAFQVQPFLLGFDFFRVEYKNGHVLVLKEGKGGGFEAIEPDHPEYLVPRGICRTVGNTIRSYDIELFRLTVAVHQQTAYIISCRAD